MFLVDEEVNKSADEVFGQPGVQVDNEGGVAPPPMSSRNPDTKPGRIEGSTNHQGQEVRLWECNAEVNESADGDCLGDWGQLHSARETQATHGCGLHQLLGVGRSLAGCTFNHM